MKAIMTQTVIKNIARSLLKCGVEKQVAKNQNLESQGKTLRAASGKLYHLLTEAFSGMTLTVRVSLVASLWLPHWVVNQAIIILRHLYIFSIGLHAM